MSKEGNISKLKGLPSNILIDKKSRICVYEIKEQKKKKICSHYKNFTLEVRLEMVKTFRGKKKKRKLGASIETTAPVMGTLQGNRRVDRVRPPPTKKNDKQ